MDVCLHVMSYLEVGTFLGREFSHAFLFVLMGIWDIGILGCISSR